MLFSHLCYSWDFCKPETGLIFIYLFNHLFIYKQTSVWSFQMSIEKKNLILSPIVYKVSSNSYISYCFFKYLYQYLKLSSNTYPTRTQMKWLCVGMRIFYLAYYLSCVYQHECEPMNVVMLLILNEVTDN